MTTVGQSRDELLAEFAERYPYKYKSLTNEERESFADHLEKEGRIPSLRKLNILLGPDIENLEDRDSSMLR